MKRAHRMPFGAEIEDSIRTRFRLWAPSARGVELVLAQSSGDRVLPMPSAQSGWYELATDARAGSRYRFRIDGKMEVPDPASRYNPDDVHGASEVIDPLAFEWPDDEWRGRPWSDAVIYEMHIGTFSPEGTFAGAEQRLDHLLKLGVTAIELMPLADFPGSRNWGYDGVLQYAPDAAYGRPEDLKRLIAAAHARNLMVFIDVVYNHFGPEGNYLHAYASDFFTDRHTTDWGAAINYDGANSRAVRDFFIHNTLYWLEEFHFDGLRFDAVHAIADDSKPHILEALAGAVRAGPGVDREIHLMLENDHNQSRYLKHQSAKPDLYTAQWNDDQHHVFHVLLTGESDGYYADYAGDPAQQLGRCLTEGFAYQGDPSPYRDNQARGEPSADLPPAAFVTFLQNHDQIGNRALGERLPVLADARRLRAAVTAWLLAPSPPMLFMGEEFAAATPFLFFCDFGAELAQAVTEGRRREFSRFARFADPEAQNAIPDPNDPATFERSKLDWKTLESPEHASWLELYTKLLALRSRQLAPRLRGMRGKAGRYVTASRGALVATWQLGDGSTLDVRLNLSEQAATAPAAPSGELLHCEPPSASAAFTAGELPPDSTAVYLSAAGKP